MQNTQETTRPVSPEAEDLLSRLRDHYRNQGKTAAASNYARHLRKYFSWAETSGYSLQTLPADSVETYLESLDQKETSKYVIRTQIKSALREAHNSLGVDFAHIQYESGKPKVVRQAQKAKEKEKRAEKRLEKAASVLQLPFVPMPVQQPLPEENYIEEYDHMAAEATPTDRLTTPTPVGVSAGGNQQPIVVMMPQQPVQKQQQQSNKPLATIGAGAQTRGITINNHTFSGSHIRVSRVADGNDPFVPMGTESYVTTLMASQLAPHGDVAAYMQQFIIPKLRLSPNTAQVPFVFHELNDRKQPTGRRDELVVGVPMHMTGDGSLNGMPSTPAPYGQLPMQFDRPTEFMFKRLDEEAAESKKRAEKLDEELRASKDSQTQFLLMQQMQREQDLRRELEQQKMHAMQQASASMNAAPPPAPIIMPPEPKPDMSIELVKAQTESQSRLLEAILVKAMTPPPPPPPQKDVSEWLVPFIAQMNQQAMAQQQSNQALLLQQAQQTQQFMQAFLTRENPMEKFLLAQLQEVKAQANAPKDDDVEDFADKLQKFKMVGEMLGGGGGNNGGGGIIESLLANADAIGEGVAKVLAARNPGPQLPVRASPPAPAPELAPAPQLQAAPSTPVKPSEATVAFLNSAAQKAQAGDEQGTITDIVEMVKSMMAEPAPFPAYADRILTALQSIEDDDDLYALTKHLWVFMGQKPNKPAAKAIAGVFFKWFPLVHENLFGAKRYLLGQTEESFAAIMAEGAPQIPPAQSADEEELDEELDSDDDGDEYEDSDGESDDDEGDDAQLGN